MNTARHDPHAEHHDHAEHRGHPEHTEHAESAAHAGHDVQPGHTEHAGHGGAAGHDPHAGHGGSATLGLARAEGGYQLGAVRAPGSPGEPGTLAFEITGPDGEAVTDFAEQHDKQLHLIVARSDGAHFRHVHPVLDEQGTWSLPWAWDAPGTYRVFADFIPSATGAGLTLSTTVEATGEETPQAATPRAETTTGGYDVAVHGTLTPGRGSELRFTVSRDGEPVTSLEPYLGAFGHLVALRDGDLAYLHAHPHGETPQPGDTSGPLITFEVTAPTSGRYLLFLDFQVAGTVFTAPLVLDTVG
ncbi:heavy-metal-associated domain-containing protein [Leucobacter sp. M11]|uniref:heavy-metal-associated domain-containing protein n=1 Tax=Leucobacter sp. M11 TaxID=2993565 RepID=UPI002D7FA9FF|nr:heavy-metal-associated domain-containing protein [Leucobacter sp. M11]MEB4616351.1 heavy-metal-associated domain-containing protein [Leucobacter sp. M11]